VHPEPGGAPRACCRTRNSGIPVFAVAILASAAVRAFDRRGALRMEPLYKITTLLLARRVARRCWLLEGWNGRLSTAGSSWAGIRRRHRRLRRLCSQPQRKFCI
jgi:hypothetical protein